MKKRIYLLLLAMVVIFFSCRDESGKFEEQLFTNDQITHALRECIRVSVDTTLNTLCVVDTTKYELGFNYFEDYRINLPAVAQNVVDTLELYGYKNTIDALVFDINRAAEQCGNNIKRFWENIIKDMTFPNQNSLLRGNNDAITNFVKVTRQNEFTTALTSSILKEQFDALNIVTRWNELQEIYFNKTGNFSSIDIFIPATQQLADGFFRKMAWAEGEVRDHPELRGPTNGWLYKVFATL